MAKSAADIHSPRHRSQPISAIAGRLVIPWLGETRAAPRSLAGPRGSASQKHDSICWNDVTLQDGNCFPITARCGHSCRSLFNCCTGPRRRSGVIRVIVKGRLARGIEQHRSFTFTSALRRPAVGGRPGNWVEAARRAIPADFGTTPFAQGLKEFHYSISRAGCQICPHVSAHRTRLACSGRGHCRHQDRRHGSYNADHHVVDQRAPSWTISICSQ